MSITFSKTESLRFQKKIHRGSYEKISVKDIKEEFSLHHPDMIIVRYPVSQQSELYKFNIENINYLVADSLLYYKCNLNKLDINPLKNNDLTIQKIGLDYQEMLADLIDVVFQNYRNHYSSNPLFNVKDIIEGYKEWANSFLLDENKDVFLFTKGKLATAFATCSLDQNNESEGVLYGVHPDFSGNGLYTDLIRYTMNYYKQLGVSQMNVSTQLQNIAVQKVWMREGFVIDKAYITVHIFKDDYI